MSLAYAKDVGDIPICGYCNHWRQNFEGSRSKGICVLSEEETNEKQGCEEYEG